MTRSMIPILVAALALNGCAAPVYAADDCHRPEALKELFSTLPTVIYPFTGDNAQALASSLAEASGGPAWKASTVQAVYMLGRDEVVFYLYSEAGCWVSGYEGGNVAAALEIFSAAGVTAPFGKTFYQSI